MFKKFLAQNRDLFSFLGFITVFSAAILSITGDSAALNFLKIISSLIILISITIISIFVYNFLSDIDKRIKKQKPFFELELAPTFGIFYILFIIVFFIFLKESFVHGLSLFFSIIYFCLYPLVIPLYFYFFNKAIIKSSNNILSFIKKIFVPCLLVSAISFILASFYNYADRDFLKIVSLSYFIDIIKKLIPFFSFFISSIVISIFLFIGFIVYKKIKNKNKIF